MKKKTTNKLMTRSLFNRLGNYCLLLILALFSNACIEPFDSDIIGNTELISIEGSLIKGDALQHVMISTTTSLLESKFLPVRGCEVIVVDELNNEFRFEENTEGTYSLAIADNMLVYNRQYKLNITTPNGNEYESEYETLKSSVAIDTAYYIKEDRIESFSGTEMTGFQFYIDVKAPDTVSRYFRWNITETYEYTSSGPISYRYLDERFDPIPLKDEFAYYRCWISDEVPGILLSNTRNLTVNEKKKIPLYYVSTLSDRLKIKFSVLVSQYTLSEGAYNYWNQNKIATEQSGGLYTQQPGQPLTNFRCVNNSSEKVLGYFWASSRTEQRLFVPNIDEPVIDFKCDVVKYEYNVHGDGPFPIYIFEDEETKVKYTAPPICFLCPMRGGSTTKPKFWQ